MINLIYKGYIKDLTRDGQERLTENEIIFGSYKNKKSSARIVPAELFDFIIF